MLGLAWSGRTQFVGFLLVNYQYLYFYYAFDLKFPVHKGVSMKHHIAAIALSFLGASALANDAGLTDSGANFNEASLSYANYKSGTTSYNGYLTELGFVINSNIYALGSYQNFDTGSITQGSLGLGYKMPIGSSSDGFFTLKYESDNTASVNNGYSLAAGVRTVVTPDMDFSGSYSFRTMGSSHDYTFNVGLKYKFNSNMFAKIGYATTSGDSSTSMYAIGVGVDF
jgi:hypothetical protein